MQRPAVLLGIGILFCLIESDSQNRTLVLLLVYITHDKFHRVALLFVLTRLRDWPICFIAPGNATRRRVVSALSFSYGLQGRYHSLQWLLGLQTRFLIRDMAVEVGRRLGSRVHALVGRQSTSFRNFLDDAINEDRMTVAWT